MAKERQTVEKNVTLLVANPPRPRPILLGASLVLWIGFLLWMAWIAL